MTYKRILELIISKEKKGLEELYYNYGKKLYSFAIKRWNFSEDEAWQIIYKTFDTLIDKLSGYTFESQKHFDNFIYKVFINFLREFYRKKMATNQEIEFVNFSDMKNDYLDSILRDGSEEDIDLKIDKEVFFKYYIEEKIDNPYITYLGKALNMLTNDEKDLLLLKAQNYSYTEIASLMGSEEKNLKVTHFRARKKLINIINQIINNKN